MKSVLLSVALLFSVPALAGDALVIFQQAWKNAPGVADYLASSTISGSTVTITTRSGVVVPVKFYSRLNATILNVYLNSGYSVDVSDCGDADRFIPGSSSHEGGCTRSAFTVKFECSIFENAKPLHDVNVKHYAIQDVVKHPLETERFRCYQYRNKF